jgi:hypothetical protein
LVLKKRRIRPMTNEYELATVIELGNAQAVVLGEKVIAQQFESLTLEYGSRYVPELDD